MAVRLGKPTFNIARGPSQRSSYPVGSIGISLLIGHLMKWQPADIRPALNTDCPGATPYVYKVWWDFRLVPPASVFWPHSFCNTKACSCSCGKMTCQDFFAYLKGGSSASQPTSGKVGERFRPSELFVSCIGGRKKNLHLLPGFCRRF